MDSDFVSDKGSDMVSDKGSDKGSDMDTDQEEEEDTLLWAETEAIFLRIAALQEEATRRTEALMARLNSEWILSCHLASSEELKTTGEVTFGKRLLERLNGM